MDSELRDVLMPIAIIGTFGLTVTIFVKTITDYFLRKKMVENGLVGADASELLRKQADSKYSALKWGLIVLFGGLGLILLEAIPYNEKSTLPYGIFASCLSLGFLTYFFLVKKWSNE